MSEPVTSQSPAAHEPRSHPEAPAEGSDEATAAEEPQPRQHSEDPAEG
jgi:hypothetical protein